MLDLIVAALLAQAQAPDPCYVGPVEALPAACPRWREFVVNREMDARGYIDPGSVRRDGHYVELDTLTVPGRPIEGRVARFVMRVRLDCTARTTLLLRMSGWDQAGRRVLDRPVDPEPPSPVPPDSPRARMLAEYCVRAS